MVNVQKIEYISRIRRVMEYITNNVKEELDLETIADVAEFSPFHFHHVLSSIAGETLLQFIQRIKLERAAYMLSKEAISVSEIFHDCGYNSHAQFKKEFTNHFGIDPIDWRKGKDKEWQEENSIYKSFQEDMMSMYFCRNNSTTAENKNWTVGIKNIGVEGKVVIEEREDMSIAYLQAAGAYTSYSDEMDENFNKIIKWAVDKKVLSYPDSKIITVYHDNPCITDDSDLRLSSGISIPHDHEVDGDVKKMKLNKGTYAVAKFELYEDDFYEAWTCLFAAWMPVSGYQPVYEEEVFEEYLNDPELHPDKKYLVKIYIPIKPI